LNVGVRVDSSCADVAFDDDYLARVVEYNHPTSTHRARCDTIIVFRRP
jgi:hypothetical protein